MNRQLVHDGNPVLTWAVSNVPIEMDAAGNKKPSKERSRERIRSRCRCRYGRGTGNHRTAADGVCTFFLEIRCHR
jgi:hypothetical protein